MSLPPVMHAGPNTGSEFGWRYECIKLFDHHKHKKILQTDSTLLFCFMFSLGKYALL